MQWQDKGLLIKYLYYNKIPSNSYSSTKYHNEHLTLHQQVYVRYCEYLD